MAGKLSKGRKPWIKTLLLQGRLFCNTLLSCIPTDASGLRAERDRTLNPCRSWWLKGSLGAVSTDCPVSAMVTGHGGTQMAVMLSALRPAFPPGRFLVFISVRGCVDTRACSLNPLCYLNSLPSLSLLFSVSGFALSYTPNVHILMILDDISLLVPHREQIPSP
jgi:hypothetical protein